MATSRLTGNQIISSALSRIGNDTITLEAQTELQLIINRLNEDYKWPFNRVTTTGNITTSTVALPADFVDFWDRFSFSMYDSTGSLIPAIVIPTQNFELSPSASTINGTPSTVWHDVENNQLVLDTTPTTVTTYRLIYRQLPAQISDYDAVVNFPNDSLLIQLLFVWALQFEDDDRYVQELQVVDKMLARYWRRWGISASINSKIAYNPSTFGTLRNFR